VIDMVSVEVKGLHYYPITIRLAKLLLFINNRVLVLNSFVTVGVYK